MKEQWKAIQGFVGKYAISNLGNVKSLARYANVKGGGLRFVKERTLKQVNKNGYLFVSMLTGNIKRQYSVHRLVAKAFIPNPEKKPMINHINGVKTDNCVKNLEWCTNSENQIHAVKILGVIHKGYNKGKCGKRWIHFDMYGHCYVQIKKGHIINHFFSSLDAEKATGINASCIRAVCRGEKKQAGGYEWQYDNMRTTKGGNNE